ncbi:MAG: TonB-dependent receptor plug domain-containing protein [Oleiphilus sp.]
MSIKTKTAIQTTLKLTMPFVFLSFLQPNFALANDESLWEMSLEELGQIRVTTLATGTATPLDKAAAVATVITEEDIIAMGATDIDQVLETVPGLHVNRSTQAFSPNYTFRGITSSYNPQTLLLINGIPITNLYIGNRSQVWGGMPVKAIKQIEVIRGPGSALYGADAFSGVINIITKSRKDINGTQVGSRAGSFDTRAAWMEHGETFNGYEVGVSLEYQKTDGWKEEVEADGIGASGPVSTGVKSTELRLAIAKDDWNLRLGYQGRRDIGVAAGIAQFLDPQGRYDSDRINADASYRLKDAAPNLDIEGQFSYYYNTQEVAENPVLLPAGVPGFPEGVIGTPGFKEQQVRFNINGIFDGLKQHLIRFGVGAYWGDLFETTEKKNFDLDLSQPFPFVPKGSLVDVSDTAEVFLPEKDRTNYHAFIQDEWQFADNWALTSGVRYDHYSDFGDTTNPRVALVWATTDSITSKLLYGRAFRAPAILELFATGNPVILGNSDLDPEIIDSYELALSHQLNSHFLYRANLFAYKIKDYIEYVAAQAQNTGKRTGKGVELEMEYSPSSSSKYFANYAYQKAKNKNTNEDAGESPNHQFYVRAEWRTDDKWIISPQLNWVGKQLRVDGDSRPPTPHYTTVDLTIRQLNVISNLDIALSIRNMFDRDVFEPSPDGLPAPSIPNDFPMAGRSIYGEIAYSF